MPTDARRCDGQVRVLQLARLVERERTVSLAELAAEFEVCERTIRRDLRAIARAGGWPVPAIATSDPATPRDARGRYLPAARRT